MGSKVKAYSREKLQGKVYTPDWVVRKILDEVGCSGDRVIGKKIVDPACGDGQFLVEVVHRIVSASPSHDLANNLSFVHGWDIDAQAISECKERLNQLIPEQLRPFDWNVRLRNPLIEISDPASVWAVDPELFDYVVGNPPYIRIQHLSLNDRHLVTRSYSYCQNGATDIYFAFIQLGLTLLRPQGRLGFIVPNSFLTSNAGSVMREDLARNYWVAFLCNFGAQKLFDNASTYNAIVVIENTSPKPVVVEEAEMEVPTRRFSIPPERLLGGIWALSQRKSTDEVGMVPLSDVCKIHVGITTLADKVFVIRGVEGSGFVSFTSTTTGQEYRIERETLLAAIKASKSHALRTPEWVIWPYLRGTSKLIAENDFKARYPNAYQYLCDHRPRLDARDNGRPVVGGWYGFGRTQALTTVFGPKIIFPPMSLNPDFSFEPDANAVIYSGYFIKYAGDNQKLLNELNSDRMRVWQHSHGRDFRGGWKSQSKSTIEAFPVPKVLKVS